MMIQADGLTSARMLDENFTDAFEFAQIDDEAQIVLGLGGQFLFDFLVARQKMVHFGHGVLDVERDLLTQKPQPLAQCQNRADAVAVGVLVRRDQKGFRCLDFFDERFEVNRFGFHFSGFPICERVVRCGFFRQRCCRNKI